MAVAEQTLQQLRTAGLAEIDPEIAELLGRELERQRGQIELIASENFTWPSVFEAVGSVPTNKYAEGYPGKRYYGGCEVIDEIEQTAIDRALSLFGAEHANVQPHAGAQTNMAVYLAALEHGDTILSLELSHGGHLTHGLKVNFSGRLYTIVHYGVEPRDEPRRLRRGAPPREGAQAEADHLRRVGLSAHRRGRQVPRGRRRGRRAAALRHGALRRPRRGRPASEPGAALRLRHLDHAQDARRAARRASSSARRSTPRRSTAPSSRVCRAGRSAMRSPRRRPASRSLRARPSGTTRPRCGRTRTRSPRRFRRAASTCSPAAPTRICSRSISEDGLDREGRGGAAGRGQDHRQQEHRAVRRASADGCLRHPGRHAGHDDARIRRGGLHARSARSSSARSPSSPDIGRARGHAARRSAPSGRSTRASAATPRTREHRRRSRPPACPAQALLLARQADLDRRLPPARPRADRASHLRGDEGPAHRDGSGRDAARVDGGRADLRQEGRRLPGAAGRGRDARRLPRARRGRPCRVHRPLPRRGDARADRVLREAAERPRRSRRDRARPDAGDRELVRGGDRRSEGGGCALGHA